MPDNVSSIADLLSPFANVSERNASHRRSVHTRDSPAMVAAQLEGCSESTALHSRALPRGADINRRDPESDEQIHVTGVVDSKLLTGLLVVRLHCPLVGSYNSALVRHVAELFWLVLL